MSMKCVEKSKIIIETVKPDQFKAHTKWADWIPFLMKYFICTPRRYRVPLWYSVYNIVKYSIYHNTRLLDHYTSMHLLKHEAFKFYESKVQTLPMKFNAVVDMSGTKIQYHSNQKNGGLDYLTLHDNFEGVSVIEIYIT